MNIPVYVYFLFVFLLYIGIKRSVDRTISLGRLFIAPLIFLILSFRGVVTLFDVGVLSISSWILGGFIGMVLGFQHVRNKEIKADHDQRLIKIPGDWSMLALILSVFVIEFVIHYLIESGSQVSAGLPFKIVSLILLGIIAGTSLGRSTTYCIKYKNAVNSSLAR